jgi:hypothetical protein
MVPKSNLWSSPFYRSGGSELCHTIVGSPRARHHLSEGMQLAAHRHMKIVGEPATLWAVVSSIVQSTLECSPNDTFRVKVVGELVAYSRSWRSGARS